MFPWNFGTCSVKEEPSEDTKVFYGNRKRNTSEKIIGLPDCYQLLFPRWTWSSIVRQHLFLLFLESTKHLSGLWQYAFCCYLGGMEGNGRKVCFDSWTPHLFAKWQLTCSSDTSGERLRLPISERMKWALWVFSTNQKLLVVLPYGDSVSYETPFDYWFLWSQKSLCA